MNEALSEFWQLMALEATPWFLSLGIVIAALLIWLQFRWRMNRLAGALDQISTTIASTEGGSAFKQRYPAVFGELAANPVLGDLWRAYASTLVQNKDQDQPIGYTRRPREAFNEQVILTAGVDLRFYGAVPSLLVGIGLLFSFVGLVSALYFAAEGVASDSVKDAQLALSNLLAVATFKFMTSIAGLAASILFNWAEKGQIYRIQQRLQRICAALEARMVPVTTESLMMAQLERSRSIERHLNRLSRAVYVRVPEALEHTLASELRDAMQPLHKAIADASSRFAEAAKPPSQTAPAQDQGTKTDTVDPRIDELAALSLSRFSRSIDILQRAIEQIRRGQARSLKSKNEELEQVLEMALERLRDNRQSVAALHKALNDGRTDPDQAINSLDEIDRSMTDLRNQLQQAGVRT